MTRADSDFFSKPISRCVNRNGPKWLICMPRWRPSSVNLLPKPLEPELLIRMSIFSSSSFNSWAKRRIDASEPKSKFLITTFGLFVCWIIWFLTSSLQLLLAIITLHPLAAKPSAVWYPMPELPPVTKAVLPMRLALLLHIPLVSLKHIFTRIIMRINS